jgi:D-hydroxyproline dehydrogenase subunit gamma
VTQSSTSPQFRRLKTRTGPPLALTINGTTHTAFAGDTILTALLLAGPHVRRFEFGAADDHRAGFCLMGVCQDCWVRLTDGPRVRACTTLVAAGMRISTIEAPRA